MSRALIAAALALAWAAHAGSALADDPYRAYRAAHPALAEEDLLDVARGDDLARVLAVVHNPDARIAPERVRVRELGRGGGRAVGIDEALAPGGALASGAVLVDLTQACDTIAGAGAAAKASAERRTGPASASGGASGPDFTSWLYLRGGRLVAWDLESYGPGCRAAARSVEALDHDALREVGATLFRPAGRGPFRYGVLAYDEWDDAFAAPTRTATLTLLQQGADAAPADARAQQRLAVGLQAAGDREGARRALERAMALAPSWRLPAENLVAVLGLSGDREALARAERRLAELGVASPPPPELAPRTPAP